MTYTDQERPMEQPEEGNTLNLLFCINKKMRFLLHSCLRSILRSGGYERCEVYLLHSDLAPEDTQSLAQDLGLRVRFHFVEVPQTLFQDFPETPRYPKQIYYRMAAPLLLPRELDRILYLDVDLVVINSLRELYETDFEGNYYAACTHTQGFLTRLNRARLQSEKARTYINTGVLLMNLTALRDVIRLDEINSYVRQHEKALILPDQDVLTALYGDRIKLANTLRYNLSDRILHFYNAAHPREKLDLDWVRQNAVVIHYCGRNKPWREEYVGKLGIFYRELMEEREEEA